MMGFCFLEIFPRVRRRKSACTCTYDGMDSTKTDRPLFPVHESREKTNSKTGVVPTEEQEDATQAQNLLSVDPRARPRLNTEQQVKQGKHRPREVHVKLRASLPHLCIKSDNKLLFFEKRRTREQKPPTTPIQNLRTMGNKVSLEDELVNLRITSKQMQRSAKKCEKNEKAAIEKLKKVCCVIP